MPKHRPPRHVDRAAANHSQLREADGDPVRLAQALNVKESAPSLTAASAVGGHAIRRFVPGKKRAIKVALRLRKRSTRESDDWAGAVGL